MKLFERIFGKRDKAINHQINEEEIKSEEMNIAEQSNETDHPEVPSFPKQTFKGFLKQHAHSELSPDERMLFEWLFPGFAGESEEDIRRLAESFEKLIGEYSGGLLNVIPGESRQRRFSGPNLSRRRYFSVCQSKHGDDNQTLAHELRAYRNPVKTGLVEVIDLALGCEFSVTDDTVHFEPEPSIAVIIHEIDRLPPVLKKMPFQVLPNYRGKPLHLYRFSYHLLEKEIEGVVDLRYPETREWFYNTFRKIYEDRPPIPKNSPMYTTAFSPFHLENQYPPTPKTFWEMLPTLVNPDRGGGNPGTTGSTVQYIGHWLRNHGVNGFIYPSARANFEIIFKSGELESYSGWNLVYYASDPLWPDPGIILSTYTDQSPWAWQRFLNGVTLEVALDNSELAGSFKINGVVDYWAKDQLYQLKALELVRLRYKSLPIEAAKVPPPHAFLLGGLCFRWLRLALEDHKSDQVDDSISELVGLSLLYDLYQCTGRASELRRELSRQGGVDLLYQLRECLGLCSRLAYAIENRPEGGSSSSYTLLAGEIEQALLWIVLAHHKREALAMVGRMYNDMLAIANNCVLLSPDDIEDIKKFYQIVLASVDDDTANMKNLLDLGKKLFDNVYMALPHEPYQK